MASSLVNPTNQPQQPAPGAPEEWRDLLNRLIDADLGAMANLLDERKLYDSAQELREIAEQAAALTSSSATGGEGERLDAHKRKHGGYTALETSLLEERQALAQSNRRLRAAAQPFVERVLPTMLDSDRPDDHLVAKTGIELGHFRKLRAALKDSALGEDGGAS